MAERWILPACVHYAAGGWPRCSVHARELAQNVIFINKQQLRKLSTF